MAQKRPSEKEQEPSAPSLMQATGQFLGYGLQWAGATVLFLFIGWLADGWLSTKPLLTIVGAFVGAGAGFYSLYHHIVVEPRHRTEQPPSDEGEA